MMESDLNHFRASGTVRDDCTLKRLSNGKLVSNCYLMIYEQSGSKKSRTIVRVVGWDDVARHAATHAKAGARVSIEGRLNVARWVGKTGVINVAYEIHLTAPIKPLENQWQEQPLTPDLYPPSAMDRLNKND